MDGAAHPCTGPTGCHACEVEIDPETGVVEMQRYCVVEDVGAVLNPMLLRGQLQGGIVQGFGQIVLKRFVPAVRPGSAEPGPRWMLRADRRRLAR